MALQTRLVNALGRGSGLVRGSTQFGVEGKELLELKMYMNRWLGTAAFAGLFLVLALAVCASPALAAPGDPDSSFGQDGVIAPAFCGVPTPRVDSGPPLPTDTITSPDGDIYVAGQCDQGIFVARFLPDGAVDTTYGTDGEWTGDFGTGQSPQTGDMPVSDGPPVRVALTPSGELIVATYAEDANDNPEIAVAELTDSGTLDSGFATGGVLVQQLSQQPLPDSDVTSLYWGSRPFAVAVQPDGRILIAGFADTSDSVPEVLVERLTADGEPDPSFGSDGIYEHQYGPDPSSPDVAFSVAEAMLLQPNGDIALAIAADVDSLGMSKFAIDRLTPDGTPDPTFTPTYAQLGISVKTDNPGSIPTSIAEASNGDYLIAGVAYDYDNNSSIPDHLMAVGAFSTSGPLDPSFGTGGVWTSGDAPAEAGAIAVTMNGDIVLTSDQNVYLPGSGSSGESFQYVAQLTPSGIGDSSFGSDGIRSYDLSTGSNGRNVPDTYSTGSAMASDGNLVTVGAATAPDQDVYYYVQELDMDGAPKQPTQPAAPVPAPTPTPSPMQQTTTAGPATQPPAANTQAALPAQSSTNPTAVPSDEGASAARSTASKPSTPSKVATLLSVSPNGASVSVKLRCLTTCHLTAALATIEQLGEERPVRRRETRSKLHGSKLRKETLRIGIARGTLKPGGPSVWKIELNAVGTKLLRREGRLIVMLTITAKDSQATTVTKKRLTLRSRVKGRADEQAGNGRASRPKSA